MSKSHAKQPIDDRLLDTAIDQFGRLGLEGASTRAIAAAANTAMSSITYHYGGKEGLHMAAAQHIARQMRERLMGSLADAPSAADLEPQTAVEQVLALVDSFLQVMLSPDSAPWARFIVREQLNPSKAFDVLWDELMSLMTARLIALVGRASGDRLNSTEARIRSLTIAGQIIVFRVAHATVLRTTGWDQIGPARAAEIRRIVHANIRAILAQP